MNNKNIISDKDLVLSIFEKIEKANYANEILNIFDDFQIIKKDKIDPIKYPRIKFSVSKNDINDLKKKGRLNDEFEFIFNEKYLEEQSVEFKIMYSILWKNGDLGKENTIIRGILNESQEKESALVFKHFGKYLEDKDKNIPIIDMHTIRAFAFWKIYKNEIDSINNQIRKSKSKTELNIEYYKKLGALTFKEMPLIASYVSWVKSHKLYTNKELSFNIDNVIFALGKYLS